MFFWILFWDSEGQYDLVGPYASTSQADKIAQKMDTTDYEIEKLPTMSKKKAGRLVTILLAEKEPEKFKKFAETKKR